MKRIFIVLVISLILLIGLVPTAGATPPAGPVTIVTDISFAEFPFSGTFVVNEGADILGCSGGTFVDIPFTLGPSAIQKIFTCTDGGNGSFTFIFRPSPASGPGDQNGHWEAYKSDGDFTGLRGQGDFWVVIVPPASGIETLTGVVHYDP